MKNHNRVVTLCAGALIALCGTASAVDGPVGNTQMDGGVLSVTPTVSYAELQVTVAGESVYWQKNYGPGEAVSVSIAEIGALSDGSYSYQIIAAPAMDEAAWEEAEGDEALERRLEAEENSQTHIQAGNFEVINGEIQHESTGSRDHVTETNGEEIENENK